MKSYLKILFLSLIISATFICAVGCGGEIDVPDESKDAETEATDEATDESDSDESGSAECKHVYEGEKVLLAATCQKEGILKKTCTLCKKSESVTVPKAAHTEVIDKGTAATCTESGMTDGKHCSVCNTVTVEQKPIAALGHKEILDEAVEATCSAPGKTEGKHCGVCETVLVAQTPITAEHSIVKRTWHPVTCKANGAVELYCNKCNTVRNYETILKGHYAADHEYAKIEGLCTGFKHGDKCEVCNARFIASGTYTAILSVVQSDTLGGWNGSVQFKFEYYNSLGVKQSASQITNCLDNDGYWMLKFGDYIAEGWDKDTARYIKNYSGIITIVEEDFAIVDQTFYDVFQNYFEAGEYTLSGKYEYDIYSFYTPATLYEYQSSIGSKTEIQFKYFNKDNEEFSSSYMDVSNTSNGPQLNYSTYDRIAYYSDATDWGNYDSNFQPYVVFETPQKVSKEFFEWFTSIATKQVA